MTERLKASILIPTYKRAHLLDHVLNSLVKQTFKNFEVIVVLKPSGDGTEEVIKKYKNTIKIRLILQKQGYVTDALNLGLTHAKGDIIAFLDDDAIPFSEWLQNHVRIYIKSNVGGVAGEVIPAILKGNKPLSIKNKVSEIIPNFKPFLEAIGRKIWYKPLDGLEDYLVYISKAGTVSYNTNMSQEAQQQTTKSLLGMGANMSVLRKAIEGFIFPNSWMLGLSWEQFLGWHIWKKGYALIFNPNAKVHHIIHDQTLTRNIRETKRDALRIIEHNLLFYRLYDLERNLSWMHRITWLIFSNLVDLKKICKGKELQRITAVKSTLNSEIIGIKWLISRKLGCHYSPLIDLKHFAE